MADVPDLPDANAEQSEQLVAQQLGLSAPKRKNWAADARVRDRLKHEVFPLLAIIRQRRAPLNEMWARMLRVWTLEHETQGYAGRSNIYVPAGKKGAETLVSQLVRGTFPGDDNFNVEAREVAPSTRALLQQQALKVKEVLKQRIERVAHVRSNAEVFYRQLVVTGNSPVKIYYDRRVVKGKRRRPRLDESFGLPEDSDFVLYDGPVFKTVDASCFYAWPEDASSIDDCELIFEDMTVPVSGLMQKAREGKYYLPEVEAMAGGSRISELQQATRDKLQAQGFSSPQDSAKGKGWELGDITEVYFNFDPEAEERIGESRPVPFLVTFSGNGHVLRAIENPWWHKRPPYRLGRMGTQQGRLWGTGYVEAIRELNLLLNDQTNQGMDCGTWALNPMVITNPNVIQGALGDLEPGLEVPVTDINNALRFERPPVELIQASSILTTQTMAWLQDFMGAPPVLQGGSAPGRAFRTATGIGTAQANAQLPLQEVVRLCEEDVWQEMLYYFWALDQQFAEDDFLLFFDGQTERVAPRDLAGDWWFRWMASSQTANQAVKGGQITTALQVLTSPPILMALKSNGLRFNPAPLIRRLYQEVYGFRDVDQVLIQEAVQGVAPAAAPGLPPEVGAPAEQSAAGGVDLLGGNPELMGNRLDANAIAAELGGALGGVGGPGIPEEELV